MIVVAGDTFTHLHIAGTAAATELLVAALGIWLLAGRLRVLEALAAGHLAAGTISALAVYLFRASANMPQLNNDGIAGYSANDWLAPVAVFVALSLYADLHPPANPRRYHQLRAAATIIAFAINVITI